MVDRLAMLQRMVETRSDDPFPRYGLAMEHRGRGDVAAATATFEALLERFPNYVPAYLMFGQMVRDAGDATRAGDVFDRGMKVALEVGDHHAYGELREARQSLEHV